MIAAAVVTAAATAPLPPVDEARQEAALVSALAAAVDALRAHDLDRLLPRVDEDVETIEQSIAPKAGLRFVFDAAMADRAADALSLGGQLHQLTRLPSR